MIWRESRRRGAPRANGGSGRRLVRLLGEILLLLAGVVATQPAEAFRVAGQPGRWTRWDAAPRTVLGEERSLDGGLRYSIETGDYALLRDQFLWLGGNVPTVEGFEATVRKAFENWTVVDPATGLPGGMYFVEDLATTAVDQPGDPTNVNSFLGVNAGAEIDLFAEVPHAGAGFAASVVIHVDPDFDDITLTSGTTGYSGFPISGADIRINPGFVWSLKAFEVLLTHEIGHALGFGDLEYRSGLGGGSGFIDDNFDPSTSETALATLNNSFALVVDALDPDRSPLFAYFGEINADPGLDTQGVELLMETEGYLDLLFDASLLSNDEFAGRQFLYPVAVPEPDLMIGLAVGFLGLLANGRVRTSRRAAR